MFSSLTSRRKSAPGSADARSGQSPPRTLNRSSLSLTSRKSFSSLFGLTSKHAPPRGPESYDEDAIGKDETALAHDEITFATRTEKLPSASYMLAKPNSSALERLRGRSSASGTPTLSTKRSRSFSRSRTVSASKTILDTLAVKMKAVTEFFHKEPDTASVEDPMIVADEAELSLTRTPSPQKSVRFNPNDSDGRPRTKSSPIDIPSRDPPFLPAIRLDYALMSNVFVGVPVDAPLTARPPDTPILKARMEAGPPPNPFLDHSDLKSLSAVPTPLSAINQTSENPFDDPVTISQKDNDPSQSLSNHLTQLAAGDSSKLLADQPDDSPTTVNNVRTWHKQPTSSHNPVDDVHDVHNVSDHYLRSPTNPFTTSTEDLPREHYSDNEQTENKASNDGVTTDATISIPSDEGRARGLQWQLESRDLRNDSVHHNDSDDNDADSESSEILLRPLEQDDLQQPTHEQIRQRFRHRPGTAFTITESGTILPGPSSRTNTGSGSIASALDEGTFEGGVYLGGEQGRALEENSTGTADVEPHKHVQTLTDITEEQIPLPQTPVTVHEPISPLRLEATVSSVSPSRSRKPFRFTNQTNKSPEYSPIRNADFSWQAHKISQKIGRPQLEPGRELCNPAFTKAIIGGSGHNTITKQNKQQQAARFTDQHGWCPLHEPRFTHAVAATQRFLENDLVESLSRHGGLVDFWRELGLPKDTAPERDSRKLSVAEAASLVSEAQKLSQNLHRPELVESYKSIFKAALLNRPEVPEYTYGRFAPLMSLRQSETSDEVTEDDSQADTEEPDDRTPSLSSSSCGMCRSHHKSDESKTSVEDDPTYPDSVHHNHEEELQKNDRRNVSSMTSGLDNASFNSSDFEEMPRKSKYQHTTTGPGSVRRRVCNDSSIVSLSATSTNSGMTQLSDDEQYVRGIV